MGDKSFRELVEEKRNTNSPESSDNEEQDSFRDQVEELRDSNEEADTRSNERKSFRDHVEEHQDEDRRQRNEDQQWKGWAVLVGLIILNVIGWPLLLNGQYLLAVLVVGGPIAAFLFLTEDGRKIRENVAEEMDSQEQSSNSDTRRICSNCGWQNPASNNYCHDCGEPLNSDE